MGFLQRLFGGTPAPSQRALTGDEQAVLIYLDGTGLPDEVYRNFDVAMIEDRLMEIIERDELGVYDGHEFGPTEVTLFMYGPDAERLFAGIEQALRGYPLCTNAHVVVRQGPPGSSEREFTL